MTIDDWQALGIVCGALLAVAAVAELVRRIMRGVWRWVRKLDVIIDEIRSIRPAMRQVVREEIHNHEHRWHGQTPPPAPIPTWVQPRPNGSGPGVHRAESRWY